MAGAVRRLRRLHTRLAVRRAISTTPRGPVSSGRDMADAKTRQAHVAYSAWREGLALMSPSAAVHDKGHNGRHRHGSYHIIRFIHPFIPPLLDDVVRLGRLERSEFDGRIKRRTGEQRQLDPRSPLTSTSDLRASESSEVLDGMLLDRLRVHHQVAPRLEGLAIDTSGGDTDRGRLGPSFRHVRRGRLHLGTDIIDILALDLIGADRRPPQRTVQHTGDRHRHGLGQRGRTVRLERHGLDQLDERRVRVRSRTGQRKRRAVRRTRRGEHDVERLGHVQHVRRSRSGLAAVEVEQRRVGCEDVSATSRQPSGGHGPQPTRNPVQQPILGAEQWSRSHDRGLLAKRRPHTLLALEFRAVEFRRRIGVRVEVRDVNEPRHAGVTGHLGDQFGAPADGVSSSGRSGMRAGLDLLDVHGLVRKVSRLPVAGSEVVYDVRVPDALFDLLGVPNVPFLGREGSVRVGFERRRRGSKDRERGRGAEDELHGICSRMTPRVAVEHTL